MTFALGFGVGAVGAVVTILAARRPRRHRIELGPARWPTPISTPRSNVVLRPLRDDERPPA